MFEIPILLVRISITCSTYTTECIRNIVSILSAKKKNATNLIFARYSSGKHAYIGCCALEMLKLWLEVFHSMLRGMQVFPLYFVSDTFVCTCSIHMCIKKIRKQQFEMCSAHCSLQHSNVQHLC